MRYLYSLFFLVFSLHSNFVFSQAVPNCTNPYNLGCLDAQTVGPNASWCQGQSPDKFLLDKGQMGCPANHNYYACVVMSNCSCPQGQKFNVTEVLGVKKGECIPDEPPAPEECISPNVKNLQSGECEPKTECTYPQLYDFYSNSCTNNPPNCAQGCKPNPLEPGACLCTNEPNCPDGWALGATGTTCVPSTNSSTPTSTPTSTPASQPSQNSSTPSATSSSPDTSGGDDGSGGSGGGGDDGNNTGGGAGSSSGTTSSSPSSAGGGGGSGTNWIPVNSDSDCPNKFQDTNGQWWCMGSGGVSSQGAGNCDPTAHDYLSCISRENEGGGDGGDDETTELKLGEYTQDLQARLQQAKDKYSAKINTIKSEFSEQMAVNISAGGGGLPSHQVELYGVSFEGGIAARSDFFSQISWLFMAVAAVLSLYIILSR